MQYVNESWGIAALADLVSIKTGKLNSNAAVENGAYPFFTCSRETYKVDTYSFDCEAVLLAGNNANGVYPVKYYKGRFDAYQRTYVIRSVDEGVLNNRYLFYALQLELDMLQSLSTGSATKFLTLTILNDLKVRVPSLSDQNRIVSILGAYDDLIENNTRRIEILEEMARRLYEEWFVQFRFPGHEGVEFKESELGVIPDGWNVKSFSELAVFLNGHAFKPADFSDDGVPIIKIKELNSGITDATPRFSGVLDEKYRIKNGDILFSWSAHLDAYIWKDGEGWLNQHLFKVSPDAEMPRLGLYFSLKKRMWEFRAKSSGATMQHIKRSALSEVKTVIPTSDVMQKFEAIVGPFVNQVITLKRQIANLRAQRDLLLPKLISGEIDVTDIPMPT